MTFVKSYVIYGVVIPIIIVLLLLFLAFITSNYFKKKKYSTFVCITPLFFWLLFFLIAILLFSPSYRYPLGAVFQNNDIRNITVGYVEDVTTLQSPPFYYNIQSHKWSSGKFLMVNNQIFYIPFGDISVGSAIKLIWYGDERIVYEYSIETEISKDEIGTQVYSDVDELPLDVKFEKTGKLISESSFIIFIIVSIIAYAKNCSISNYLIRKDKEVTGKLIPSKNTVVECLLFSVFVLTITIGLALMGFKVAFFIGIICICIRIKITNKIMSTVLLINKNTIVVKEHKTVKRYFRDDIVDVRFETTRAPFIRCIVIELNDGQEIYFDQLHYLGLSSVYSILRDRLTIKSQDPRQGDDLRKP